MGHLLQDARHGLRMLRREPGFTLVAVLTLAIGVGANAAMFTVIDRLMLRPPAHVRAPERVVNVRRAENYVHYQDLSRIIRSLNLAVYYRSKVSLGSGPDAAEVRAECVSAGYFPLLGASPVVGRAFSSVDEAPGSTPTAMLSHGLWMRRFGGDPGAIGKTVLLAGRPHAVIGVAPSDFTGVQVEAVDAWLLLAVSPEACANGGRRLLASAESGWLTTIGRLRDGFTFTQAAGELASLDDAKCTGSRVSAATRCFRLESMLDLRAAGVTRDSRIAVWLGGAAAMVFLIACAHVAGLLSMRGLQRRREMAVRLQLGASRARILAQLLVESSVLALAGGAAAVVLSVWIGMLLRGFFPLGTVDDPLNARTLGALSLLAVAAGMISGLGVAIQGSQTDPSNLSRGGLFVVPRRARIRSVLLVAQVALALVLVLGAGLFLRSVHQAKSGLGYDLFRIVIVELDLRKAGYDDRRSRETFSTLLERVRRVPVVERAAISSGNLLGGGGSLTVTGIRAVSGRPSGGFELDQFLNAVSPDYFATLGTRIVRGRAFTALDDASPAAVMIVDERVARRNWPDGDAVGQCAYFIKTDPTCVEVVGVIESRRTWTLRAATSELFIPLGQAARQADAGSMAPQVLLVRSRTSAAQAVAPIAAAVRGASPDLPFAKVRPLEDLADVQARSWRLGSTVLGFFGATAVLLAAVGIYGTLAFAVRQRTSEIGVRMALGAKPAEILRMVLRHGAGLIAAGWLLGSLAALALTRSISSLLFNVEPTDPMTVATATLVILTAGLAGCVMPAIRAARIDPTEALRCE